MPQIRVQCSARKCQVCKYNASLPMFPHLCPDWQSNCPSGCRSVCLTEVQTYFVLVAQARGPAFFNFCVAIKTSKGSANQYGCRIGSLSTLKLKVISGQSFGLTVGGVKRRKTTGTAIARGRIHDDDARAPATNIYPLQHNEYHSSMYFYYYKS